MKKEKVRIWSKLLRICIIYLVGSIVLTSCWSNDNDWGIPMYGDTYDFSAAVIEKPNHGDPLGVIEGDGNEEYAFRIVSQSPERAFDIDRDSGEITVDDGSLYDFEVNPLITGVVVMLHEESVSTTLVTIKVIDVLGR